MNDEAIRALEIAALRFAKEYNQPHDSAQEHADKCTMASAALIAAALDIKETDEPTH